MCPNQLARARNAFWRAIDQACAIAARVRDQTGGVARPNPSSPRPPVPPIAGAGAPQA